jgi:hypothetical protein
MGGMRGNEWEARKSPTSPNRYPVLIQIAHAGRGRVNSYGPKRVFVSLSLSLSLSPSTSIFSLPLRLGLGGEGGDNGSM